MADTAPRRERTDLGSARTLYGMVEGADARALAGLAQEAAERGQALLHIAADEVRVQALTHLLQFFAPEVRTIHLPGWDCLPYDRVSPAHDVSAARIAALSACLDMRDKVGGNPVIILATAAAMTQRVMSPGILQMHRLSVKAGGQAQPEKMEDFLTRNGYARTDTVRDRGEFAVRGGIIDLFPAGFDAPVRLDLFGDMVESMKSFDPLTQRSEGTVSQIELLPATEYALDADSIARFRAGYRDAFGMPSSDDPLYAAISEGRRHNGAEHWLPLFFDAMSTVFDYVPEGPMTLDPQLAQVVAERFDQIGDYYTARAAFVSAGQEKKARGNAAPYHPLPPERLYLTATEWQDFLRTRDVTALDTFKSPVEDATESATRARDFADVRAKQGADLFSDVAAHLAALRARGVKQNVIACYSAGARERLQVLLAQANVANMVMCETWAACQKLLPLQTGLIVLPLEHGFVDGALSILTEQDILGDRMIRRATRKRKADHFISDLSTLHPGDLVVHIDHGIGRFESLETVEAAGTRHDCLKLTYDGGDRLYLPVENMEMISRYSAADTGDLVQLDRLGGAGWQARKARVKKDLMAMADDLLRIAAERQLRGAEQFSVDDAHYAQFTARFPYAETEDQQRAITDVLDDLAGGVPADRLICGDVGFGKTEVALRAAYAVAASGAQVAVVVPTTLLSRQHTNNFVRRFDGLGLRIGQLSRMVTAREAAQVKSDLADGSINVVIGTHALLAKDVKFAHLGLVIVDEEQRFGVKQKEALKALKNNVHVITLTATPIPRTLQMALSGVREMSIIATPPVDRLAIRTFVTPFDPLIVREAILRERHRGGQTFYVCPRIADLTEVEEKLRDLVPEVRVIVAHGQLAPTELDARMTAFYDGQYDVLLATNIIESGIDIPAANTMIVHRADMFGLAQLYQIRGRIGRSKTRAYAYLTYDGQMKLNKQAQKRLEVIEMLDNLGAGFQLASHDLDIRGAGNLLGDDQSGHVREVGVELYQHMLEEAVAAARHTDGPDAGAAGESWTPVINLGTSILIPENYVEDLTLRLNLYRRLSEIEDKREIESLAAEMIDRFGSLPDEVKNLLDIIEIKHICRVAGVARVDAGPKGGVIGFHNDRPPNADGLFAWMMAKKGSVKLRPDQKITIVREWSDVTHRVKGVRMLLNDLAELVGR